MTVSEEEMKGRFIYITLCPRLTPYTDYVTPANPETFAPTTPLLKKKNYRHRYKIHVISYVATDLCALLHLILFDFIFFYQSQARTRALRSSPPGVSLASQPRN